MNKLESVTAVGKLVSALKSIRNILIFKFKTARARYRKITSFQNKNVVSKIDILERTLMK